MDLSDPVLTPFSSHLGTSFLACPLFAFLASRLFTLVPPMFYLSLSHCLQKRTHLLRADDCQAAPHFNSWTTHPSLILKATLTQRQKDSCGPIWEGNVESWGYMHAIQSTDSPSHCPAFRVFFLSLPSMTLHMLAMPHGLFTILQSPLYFHTWTFCSQCF